MSRLYRQAALEKTTSREQLDKALRVTLPSSWLVILGAGLIVAAAVLWSVFGTVTRSVTAHGFVLIPDGSGERIVLCGLTPEDAWGIECGDEAFIYPRTSGGRYGAGVRTQVLAVEYPADPGAASVSGLLNGKIAFVVTCPFPEEESAARNASNGEPVEVRIVTERLHPAAVLFSGLHRIEG